jgi:hypothetical protein
MEQGLLNLKETPAEQLDEKGVVKRQNVRFVSGQDP